MLIYISLYFVIKLSLLEGHQLLLNILEGPPCCLVKIAGISEIITDTRFVLR